MVLAILFCVVLPGAPRPLLRIGTSQPAAHHGGARVCFFYRPKVMFCFAVLFAFKIQLKRKCNNKSTYKSLQLGV